MRLFGRGMKLKERGRCVASARRELACARSLGYAEQQTHQQIAPQQPAELFGKFGRTACEKS